MPNIKNNLQIENKIFIEVFEYIKYIVNFVKPKDLLFLSIDGVAPRAKMQQQRNRRFKSAKENKIILYFIFFFPGVIALAFYGYEYAALAWKIKETSWNSPAQIQIYMAKSLIPAAGILLTLQGISEVCRAIICIQTGHWPARMVVAEETEKMLMRTSQDEDQKDVI